MPTRKNLRHRAKARREQALYNLESDFGRQEKKTYDKKILEQRKKRKERMEAEIAVLKSRIGSAA